MIKYFGEKDGTMKRIIAITILSLMLINSGQIYTANRAFAAIKSITLVNLTHPGQVIDTITYNGITVEAAYSNEGYTGNDPTFSCAAFIKKFYYAVYGITVYNLLSPSSSPLVYDNKGSFSLTSSPQIGDIVRDNTRTHWAIVKSIAGNTITLIQQSYKSGSRAWIDCTIDLSDKGFSYFTYSGRIPDDTNTALTQDINTSILDNTSSSPGNITSSPDSVISIPDGITSITDSTSIAPDKNSIPEATNSDLDLTIEDDSSTIPDGTYQLIQASTGDYIHATDSDKNWRVQAKPLDNSNQQLISIVNYGKGQYSLQILSNQRFLATSDEKKLITTEAPTQKFNFVPRENGWYTISSIEDTGKIIAVGSEISLDGTTDLVLQDYRGELKEYWYVMLKDVTSLPIVPQVTLSKKTLYTGYKSYDLMLNHLTKNAFVNYTSSDPAIATVSSKGRVKPLKKGKSDITITVNQQNITYQYTVAITVKDPYLKITTKENEVKSGESIILKAKGYGTSQAFTWQVSDDKIAQIEPNSGKLTAKKKGEVLVTARNKEGFKESIRIKVF